MSRLSHPADSSPAPFDEAAEARELEAFFAQQDPVDLAAVDWHTRQEQGLSAAEEAEFQAWLSADPAHVLAFARLDDGVTAMRALPGDRVAQVRAPAGSSAAVVSTAGSPPDAGTPHRAGLPSAPRTRPDVAPPSESGAHPAAGLPSEPDARPAVGLKPRQSVRRPAASSRPSSRRAWLVACGAAALVAGIGWHQWQQSQTFSRSYVVERGQRQTITLPDGSELIFDVDTRAHVALSSGEREVRLDEGQVMFTVAPDATKPFHVVTGAARITVVGTQFSVRSRSGGMDAGATHVAVAEGHVRVLGSGSSTTPTDLVAGQALKVSATGSVGRIDSVAPASIAAWRNGLVRFDDTPLGDALVEMERYAPTGLTIRDPAVAALPLGGSFQVGRPDEFARMLTRILPVKLVKDADGRTLIVKAR